VVVLGPLVGIGQDRVRLVDVLESLLGRLVAGLLVRVVLAGELPEGLLDLRGRGRPGHAERLVVVADVHRQDTPEPDLAVRALLAQGAAEHPRERT